MGTKKYNGKEFMEMHGYNTYDCEARGMYPALMRFTTPDPLAEKYYSISPYAYCLNNPVRFVDPDGRVVMTKKMQEKYPELTNYMKNLSNEWANKSSEFKKAFMEKSGLSEKQIETMLTFGKGPRVDVANLDTKNTKTNGQTLGFPDAKTGKLTNANGGNGIIKLDDNVVGMLENAQTGKDRQVGTIMVESTTFHEFTHVGNLTTSNTFDGNFGPDSGKAFEINAFGKDINRSNVNGYWQSIQPQPLATPAVPLLSVQQIVTPRLPLNP
ncbi:RHS repeat-associated core domain-containing protein [Porphyromonadaceae sp. NP-X]|nr:RHS repeat-associated core domain-containing protein [Porphyromonadaceae sp. NP-X]